MADSNEANKSSFNLVSETLNTSLRSRIIELERREEGAAPQGDFEGSVTGYWKELNARGVGIVEFKGKEYKTRPIGFLSVPKGTEVELTHAKGVYYSKF